MEIRVFIREQQKIIDIVLIIFDLIGLIFISWFLFEAKPIHIHYKETFFGIITDFRPIVDSINKIAYNMNLLIKMWIGFTILVISNIAKIIILFFKK